VRRGAPLLAGLACIACVGSGACGGAAPVAPNWDEVGRPPRPLVDEAEPDDGVVVTGTKGRMDPEKVSAGLAPQRARLSGCYMQGVGARHWLGGNVLLRWEVAADGAIARVLVIESDLGAWSIEKCVVGVARGASFGTPIGGPAELTLPLEFSPTVRPAVWNVEQSAKAVGGQLLELDACGKAKAGAPSIAAPDEVAITLYVGRTGRAESVGFASATSAIDDAWAACAEKAALAWRLPDPKGQVTKLAVRYRPR
jgi:hypothetical protein